MEINRNLKKLISEIVNVLRMINGRNMKFSKKLSNKSISEVAKVVVFTVFGLLKIF